jgi:dolichol-phosphate mannosyltransferase
MEWKGKDNVMPIDRANIPHEDMQPASAIPTTDPDAALVFCRNLAQFLVRMSTHLPEPPTRTPVLSIVVPVYSEQANLPVLHARLSQVLGKTEPDYEIVFVNDGSRDASAQILAALAVQDPRVLVIELARNSGHQVAISAGLDYARGRAVIVMDADLQDPPEVLPDFIAKWREGYDVVYAIRARRKEHIIKRAAYALFYRILQRVASIQIPLDSGDFSIMDRRVVDLLKGMPERNRFVRGIRSWIGLNQIGLEYERHARYAGEPRYTLNRLIYLALDGLVSFSFLPLRMISMVGFGISLLSILLAIAYTIQKLTIGLSPPGFATTVVAIFFLAGVQLITIGVIGEYVGRIFEEVKHRPLYIVRQVLRAK